MGTKTTDAMRETDYGRVLTARIPTRQPDKPAGRNDRFLPRAIDGGRRPPIPRCVKRVLF